MPVWISGADIVLHGLRSTGNRVVHMAVQHFMELQDRILRDRDGVIAIVYDIQHITVSGNFPFISVFRRRFLSHQLPDTCVCRYDPFNGVGCFGALNLGDLH